VVQSEGGLQVQRYMYSVGAKTRGGKNADRGELTYGVLRNRLDADVVTTC
jgi:hypothetical protein